MSQHVGHRRSDEIHELRAEIERLRAARDAAMRVHIEDGAEIERLRGEIKALHETIGLIDRQHAAEIGRLRVALKKIAELRYVEDANEPFDEALDIADAALAPKP